MNRRIYLYSNAEWNDFISVIPATEEPSRSEFKEISALVRDSSAGITIDQPVGERC